MFTKEELHHIQDLIMVQIDTYHDHVNNGMDTKQFRPELDQSIMSKLVQKDN